MSDQKPQSAESEKRMGLNDIFYNASALLVSILLVGGALAIFFVALPEPGEKSRGVFLFIIFWELLIAGLLGTTAAFNLVRRELGFAATIIQIVAFAATLWLFPLAAWGEKVSCYLLFDNCLRLCWGGGP